MIEQFLLEIAIGLLIVLYWVAWVKVWKPIRLYLYRQHLYRLREQLFELAANGEISFESPAYQMLRKRLHAAIRFAHEFTFFRTAYLVAIILKGEWPAANKSHQKFMDSIDAEHLQVREKLGDILEQMGFNTLKYIGSTSLLLWTIVIFVIPPTLFLIGWLRLKLFLAEIVSVEDAWDDMDDRPVVAG